MASVRDRIKKFRDGRNNGFVFLEDLFTRSQKEIAEQAQRIVASGMEAILTETQNIINHHARVIADFIEEKRSTLKGDKGDTGDKGESIVGPKGDRGKDGKDGKSIVGPQGPMGLPGRDGSPDNPKDIREKLESLKGKQRLDKSAIQGLEEFALRTALAALESRLEGRITSLASRQQRFGGGSAGGGQGSWRSEAPSGTPDGTTTTFTLSQIPATNSLILQVNGAVVRPGSSNEYTLSGLTITFNSTDIPQTGDTIWAFYMNG